MSVQIDKVDGWGIKIRVFTCSDYLLWADIYSQQLKSGQEYLSLGRLIRFGYWQKIY